MQGFASTTNLDASGQGYPVQGCQQGKMPVMQGQGPAWFGAQWIPQQQTFVQQTMQARVPSFGSASMPSVRLLAFTASTRLPAARAHQFLLWQDFGVVTTNFYDDYPTCDGC